MRAQWDSIHSPQIWTNVGWCERKSGSRLAQLLWQTVGRATMGAEIYILSKVLQVPSQTSTFETLLHLCAPGFTYVKVHRSIAYKNQTKQKNKAGNDSMSINNKLDNWIVVFVKWKYETNYSSLPSIWMLLEAYVHLFDRYLLSAYYMPGTVPHAGDAKWNLYSCEREDRKQ